MQTLTKSIVLLFIVQTDMRIRTEYKILQKGARNSSRPLASRLRGGDP